MGPISEVIFAKHWINSYNVEWILFDVYKIALHYPLEVSKFGIVLAEISDTAVEYQCPLDWLNQRLKIAKKFQSKSTRNDLKGLKLKCGLVVRI